MPESNDLSLRGLIHDLNNVFQTLVEAAELLSVDPQWTPVSSAILRSIERGKEISLSLETVNQPSAAFETVLDNAMTLTRDSMIARREPPIRFDCDIEPGMILPRSWAWERVLINLFSNSVRAMPEGGTIWIRARRSATGIEISVADNGRGIPLDLLPSIFEPHVSSRPSDSRGASGLGLHIVRTIVKQENGEVLAANREGCGAEFTIRIPGEQTARSASA